MNLLDVNIEYAGYPGNKQVIKDIGFSIACGELVGLIGPNGAGKSTAIKAILGLLPELKGTVNIAGEHGKCAYVPELPVLYESLTLWEHLELAAAAFAIDRPEFLTKAESLLKLFRLTRVRHQIPATFSKGMQQKVMLILGFLAEPSVYVVDEPFVGLDPKASKDFLTLLNEARSRGAGVLMSTHVLDTAEKICDSFVLLTEGTLMAKGTLAEIRQQCGLAQGSLFDCFDRLMENCV